MIKQDIRDRYPKTSYSLILNLILSDEIVDITLQFIALITKNQITHKHNNNSSFLTHSSKPHLTLANLPSTRLTDDSRTF